MFGPYLIAVELASILLLAGLVGAYHLGWQEPETTSSPAVGAGGRMKVPAQRSEPPDGDGAAPGERALSHDREGAVPRGGAR